MAIWGYKWINGQVEAKLFDEVIEKGWEDTPAKCEEPKGKSKKEVKEDGYGE